jgi:predicted nucleic acid-binding protein
LTGKQVYIDTNIFIYVATRHPDYYAKCHDVLEALVSGDFEAYGSKLVLFELFGAISKYSVDAAYEPSLAYLSLPIKLIEPSLEALELAREIARTARVTYDSLHAALAISSGADTIVTEDLKDWKKIKNKWRQISARYSLKELHVYSPTHGYL